jgi:hypothetical protein
MLTFFKYLFLLTTSGRHAVRWAGRPEKRPRRR